MSEQSPPPSGEEEQKPRKGQRTPGLSGDWPDSSSRVDWKSIGYLGRGLGILAAFSLTASLLVQEVIPDNDKQPHASAPELAGTNTEKKIPKHDMECRNVEGLLRIVGVTAGEVRDVNESDEVAKIPNMIHQRDADGEKADITKFEWRADDTKLNEISDSPFFTAVRYHFEPYAVRGSGPMQGPEDVVVPGNVYNAGPDMVGQVLEYGHMTVCGPEGVKE